MRENLVAMETYLVTQFRWRPPLSPGDLVSFVGGRCEAGDVVKLWHQGRSASVRVEAAGTRETEWHAQAVVIGEGQ